MSENFFAMGGYAAYVWPAYGISLGVIAGAILWTFIAERRLRRRLDALEGGRR